MRNTKKLYQAPALSLHGSMVEKTRIHEVTPSETLDVALQNAVGSVGFGL